MVLPQRTWKPSCLKTALRSIPPPPPLPCPWPSTHSQCLGHFPDWPKPEKNGHRERGKGESEFSTHRLCQVHTKYHLASDICNIYFSLHNFLQCLQMWYFGINFLVLLVQEMSISVKEDIPPFRPLAPQLSHEARCGLGYEEQAWQHWFWMACKFLSVFCLWNAVN